MIEARSGRDRTACPGCATESERVHGRCHRQLADTALAGRPVVIRLLIRRLTRGRYLSRSPSRQG
uniref:transposase family protein n=1 Tax=Paractinoplanes polyasparticus TaxID=2856853 RepID=UPI0034DAF474